MRNLLLFFSLILVFSCKKDGEIYNSYTVSIDHIYYDPDNVLEVEYSIVAPGKVNIQSHGFEIRGLNSNYFYYYPFGGLSSPGKYRKTIWGLPGGEEYEVKIFYQDKFGHKSSAPKYSHGQLSGDFEIFYNWAYEGPESAEIHYYITGDDQFRMEEHWVEYKDPFDPYPIRMDLEPHGSGHYYFTLGGMTPGIPYIVNIFGRSKGVVRNSPAPPVMSKGYFYYVEIDNFTFGQDYLIVDYSIIPQGGPIYVENHFIRLYNYTTGEIEDYPMGSLTNGGSLTRAVYGLMENTSYDFYIYTENSLWGNPSSYIYSGTTEPL